MAERESLTPTLHQVADGRVARPSSKSSGQRAWPTPLRRGPLRPAYNLTIGFARNLEALGTNISTLPAYQQLIIQGLLDNGRKLEEEDEEEEAAGVIAAAPVQLPVAVPAQVSVAAPTQVPTAATPHAPAVRRQAEDVFPGTIPNKKKKLHWGNGEQASSLKNHFSRLQFRRALYEDGVDDAEGLKAMSTDDLVTMWMKHRADKEESEVASMATPVENGVADSGTPAAEEPALGPISMASMYSSHEAEASHGLPVNSRASMTPSEDLGLQINGQPTPATVLGTTQTGAHLHYSATSNATGYTTGRPAPNTTQTSPVKNKPKGRKKGVPPDPEKAIREALGARVGRYPLSIPGNNKGEPLSMHLNMEAKTIMQKYGKPMVEQLLKDYDALPTKNLPRKELAKKLVEKREEIRKSGKRFQRPWTHERLQAYVDEQEGGNQNLQATSLPTSGPGNAQSTVSSSTGLSRNTSSTGGRKGRKRTRTQVEEDSESSEDEDQPQKRQRKTKKATSRRTNTSTTTTSNSPISTLPTISSSGTTTSSSVDTTRKRTRDAANLDEEEAETSTRPRRRQALKSKEGTAASSPPPQMQTSAYQYPEPSNNSFVNQYQWAGVQTGAHEQTFTFQHDGQTFDEQDIEIEEGYEQSHRAWISQLEHPSGTVSNGYTTRPSIPDNFIDPSLLDL